MKSFKCYILLLPVAVQVTTPAALHGMKNKVEEEWVAGEDGFI